MMNVVYAHGGEEKPLELEDGATYGEAVKAGGAAKSVFGSTSAHVVTKRFRVPSSRRRPRLRA